MGFPTIVCPGSDSLLQSFTGFSVTLRLKSCDHIGPGVEKVWKSGNTLNGVIVESDRPLADIELDDHRQGIPLAVMAPSLGHFRHLAKHLDRLRNLSLRVYLPCDHPDNLASLRILSSVGIHCCADFRPGRTDWESLADLATYALLGRVPHAAIEPFVFMAANYHSSQYIDWGRVTFDDPRYFLHLDEAGRVALSQAELDEKRFVAHRLSEIGTPEEFPPIRERLQSWKHYFADNHPCASCAGWKICHGKFSDDLTRKPGCSEFFMDLIDLIRQRLALQVAQEERRIWQP